MGGSKRHAACGAAWWLVVFGLLSGAATGWACPGCKEALFDPGQLHQKLWAAKGYALSIGLLLLAPAILVAALALMIVRGARRAGDAHGKAPAEPRATQAPDWAEPKP